jgi:hypothetical protein
LSSVTAELAISEVPTALGEICQSFRLEARIVMSPLFPAVREAPEEIAVILPVESTVNCGDSYCPAVKPGIGVNSFSPTTLALIS